MANDDVLPLPDHLRWQAVACGVVGSPFVQTFLEALADDAAADGPTAAILADRVDSPFGDYLGLRLAGFLHHEALQGHPRLRAHYPSCGGDADAAAAARVAIEFLRDVESERSDPRSAYWNTDDPASLACYLGRPPQTNEAGRASALLAGDAWIHATMRRPLRILEIGSSAGLLLHLDRYAMRLVGTGGIGGIGQLGAPDAPSWDVAWSGPLPPPQWALPEIVSAEGCDRAPLDISLPGNVAILRSYVWPDQPARLARLDTALAVAAAWSDRPVSTAPAETWLPAQLARPTSGLATVIQHSIVWEYIDSAAQEQLAAEIAAAGSRATPETPLAWLRMEFFPKMADNDLTRPSIRVTTWPGGEDRLLGWTTPHGADVEWLETWPG